MVAGQEPNLHLSQKVTYWDYLAYSVSYSSASKILVHYGERTSSAIKKNFEYVSPPQ